MKKTKEELAYLDAIFIGKLKRNALVARNILRGLHRDLKGRAAERYCDRVQYAIDALECEVDLDHVEQKL